MVRKILTDEEKQKRKDIRNRKQHILRLYKQDWDISAIREELAYTWQKITTTDIKNYLMGYFRRRNDNLCREITQLEGCCKICKQTSVRLEDAHYIRRGFDKYRWDLNNHGLLCVSHHGGGRMGYNRYCSAHGDEQAISGFWAEMRKVDPDTWQWYQDHKDDHEIVKFTLDDLQKIHEKLEQELKDRKESNDGKES